jgi:hypothetical protein
LKCLFLLKVALLHFVLRPHPKRCGAFRSVRQRVMTNLAERLTQRERPDVCKISNATSSMNALRAA